MTRPTATSESPVVATPEVRAKGWRAWGARHRRSLLLGGFVLGGLIVLGASCVPINQEPPSVAGDAVIGAELKATPGSWSEPTDITGYRYQWYSCANGSSSCDPVGTDTDQYEVHENDAGRSVHVEVRAINDVGVSRPEPSNSVGPIAGSGAPPKPDGARCETAPGGETCIYFEADDGEILDVWVGVYPDEPGGCFDARFELEVRHPILTHFTAPAPTRAGRVAGCGEGAAARIFLDWGLPHGGVVCASTDDAVSSFDGTPPTACGTVAPQNKPVRDFRATCARDDHTQPLGGRNCVLFFSDSTGEPSGIFAWRSEPTSASRCFSLRLRAEPWFDSSVGVRCVPGSVSTYRNLPAEMQPGQSISFTAADSSEQAQGREVTLSVPVPELDREQRCAPSGYVLFTCIGLRSDGGEALSAVVTLQGSVAPWPYGDLCDESVAVEVHAGSGVTRHGPVEHAGCREQPRVGWVSSTTIVPLAAETIDGALVCASIDQEFVVPGAEACVTVAPIATGSDQVECVADDVDDPGGAINCLRLERDEDLTVSAFRITRYLDEPVDEACRPGGSVVDDATPSRVWAAPDTGGPCETTAAVGHRLHRVDLRLPVGEKLRLDRLYSASLYRESAPGGAGPKQRFEIGDPIPIFPLAHNGGYVDIEGFESGVHSLGEWVPISFRCFPRSVRDADCHVAVDGRELRSGENLPTSEPGNHELRMWITDDDIDSLPQTLNYEVVDLPIVKPVVPKPEAVYELNSDHTAEIYCYDPRDSIGECTATIGGDVFTNGDLIPTGPNPGWVDFSVTAIAGGRERTRSGLEYFIQQDLDKPTIVIDSPTTDGTTELVQGQVFPALYQCTDNDGELEECSAVVRRVGTQSESEVRHFGPLRTDRVGDWELVVTAEDENGRTATAAARYTVRAVETEIVIDSPPAQSVNIGEHVFADFSCEHAVALLKPCEAFDTEDRSVKNGERLVDADSDGDKTFTVVATDIFGNVKTSVREWRIVGDSTPPTMSILVPTNGRKFAANQRVDADLYCYDAGGLATHPDGEDWCRATARWMGNYASDPSGASYVLHDNEALPTHRAGWWVLSGESRDQAGNTNTAEHRYFVGSVPTGNRSASVSAISLGGGTLSASATWRLRTDAKTLDFVDKDIGNVPPDCADHDFRFGIEMTEPGQSPRTRWGSWGTNLGCAGGTAPVTAPLARVDVGTRVCFLYQASTYTGTARVCLVLDAPWDPVAGQQSEVGPLESDGGTRETG